MRPLDPLRFALGFLTVLPVGARRWEPAAAARAAVWFPLVGLLLGAVLYACMRLPLPDLPRAALTLVAWAALTGGFHDDGWMDTLDAAFAPLPPERRLEIMKDPHVGAHAVTGAVLLQIARFAALTVVPAAALLVAPVVGRGAMAISPAVAKPARPDGLGATLTAGARPALPALTTVAALAGIGLAWRPAAVFAAALAGGAAAVLWGWFLARRFGGLSGDAHGSLGVLAELVALWVFLPAIWNA